MLGVGFNDDDNQDDIKVVDLVDLKQKSMNDIKITSNEGRSGDTESVTTLANLVDENYLVW